MSDPAASEADRGQGAQESDAEEDEVLDGIPVLTGSPRIVPAQAAVESLPAERRTAGMVLPAVQAAAVAAGGFVAGAAVVGLVHRRQRRSGALTKGRRSAHSMRRGSAARKDGRAGELLQIVGSRSLLVDVHLLGGGTDS